MTLPHALRLPSLWPAPKESAVHVVILIVYAFTAWLALLAWCVIVGTPVPLWVVLCVAPFVISGVIVALVALDLALLGLRWLWRGRSTLRWRRSHE